MSEGFASPIIGGGGGLVYPSIHSPNFVTAVSGWTINKDGSAEFDNLTIRGSFEGTDFEINQHGWFAYNGTPALGNGPFSYSVPNGVTQDRFGNALAGPGLVSEASTGAFSQLFGGNLVLQDSSGSNEWVVQAATVGGVKYLQLIPNVGGTLVVSSAGFAVAQNPVSGAPESWQAGSGLLLAPWTSVAGFPFEYELEPINGGRVRLRGQITNSVAYVGFNNVTGAAPSGYGGTATAWDSVWDTTAQASIGIKTQGGPLAFLQFTANVPINHVIALDGICLPLD